MRAYHNISLGIEIICCLSAVFVDVDVVVAVAAAVVMVVLFLIFIFFILVHFNFRSSLSSTDLLLLPNKFCRMSNQNRLKYLTESFNNDAPLTFISFFRYFFFFKLLSICDCFCPSEQDLFRKVKLKCALRLTSQKVYFHLLLSLSLSQFMHLSFYGMVQYDTTPAKQYKQKK